MLKAGLITEAALDRAVGNVIRQKVTGPAGRCRGRNEPYYTARIQLLIQLSVRIRAERPSDRECHE
jgi:hypothetical protein